MRPKIGLTTADHMDGTTAYFRSPQTYANAVWLAGGLPLLLPPDERQAQEIAQGLDGLVLTGGGDIHPARLGQEPHPKASGISLARDGCEFALINAFLRAGKPILGICRGAQVIAAALGGQLCQHVPDLPHTRLDHNDPAMRHGVTTVPGSLVHRLYGAQATVNSTHHQAVIRPPGGFTVTALSEDGLIEAIEGERCVGVQWHPERILDENKGNAALFRWLIGLALTKE